MGFDHANPYIGRRAEFLGCEIDLFSRPLFPRPETEFWTEQFIKIAPKTTRIKILDAFAGSGCVGIAITAGVKNAEVDFAEISGAHCAQIRKNMEINGFGKRNYKIYRTNILKDTDIYDFILANPPYLKKEDLAGGITDYEPKRALVGGKDGMSHIRRLLGQAPRHLKPEGSLWMEFESGQKNEIAALAERIGYNNIEFRKDQYGKFRCAIMS